ncbi:MAG TPA: UDP-N-acetylmuramoyl-tripeptide--D-alanyl-D-alanine ligase [Bacillota bacterium]|nr:UDP-N-acetylmuramoyl-tripeptide--D-alanyl-D-alanine ligase [Bacillota bacterium]
MLRDYTTQELAGIMQGHFILGEGKAKVRCIGRPSHRRGPYELYFWFDEYTSLNYVDATKTSAIVVEAPHSLDLTLWKDKGIEIIEVENITEAFYRLAAYYRVQFSIPVIEVVGSSGKSTTKEMIGSILREQFHTLISPRTMNSPFGVASNLFELSDIVEAAVLEAGMKTLGVIRCSTRMVQPTIGVITAIHRAHYSRMRSMERILAAKAELIEYLDPNGILIVNGEDEYCNELPIANYAGKVLRFGFSNKYDIWAEEIHTMGFSTFFVVKGKEGEFPVMIPTYGKYNVGNALAAILVGLHLGISIENICMGLAKYTPLEGRQQLIYGSDDSILVNDNFNANPDCTRLFLEEIPHLSADRPTILVLGDMEGPNVRNLEYAKDVHYQIGLQLATLKFLKLVAIGGWAKEYVNGALAGGTPREKIYYYSSVEEAMPHIEEFYFPRSLYLFKASKTYIDLSDLIESIRRGHH